MSLDLKQVTASLGGTRILHGIDLTVPAGELLVVLGPSGAGKSTLLRVIAGLEAATSGHVHIGGREVTALRPGLRNVAMVFQSSALFPHLTVTENIMFGPTVRDVRRAEARARATAAAQATGCAHLLDRRPDQLSGGERQRVALARALVRDPEVFLLDEPLSNLDAELRLQIRDELRTLHESVGATMVHVTHDQTEAMALGDRIAVLREGRVEQIGTPSEIWNEPASLFVATFVGSPPMNVLSASLWGHPNAHQVGFRAEAVHLTEDGRPASVERVTLLGEDALVKLRLGEQSLVARVAAAQRPSAGDKVGVTVRAGAIHAFDASGARL